MSELYAGQAIRVTQDGDGIVELNFDLQGDSVNKLNALTVKELSEAVDKIGATQGVKGLLLASGKPVFIVGADITEFLEHFKKTDDEFKAWLMNVHTTLNKIEDFDFPVVALINGYALGGGFEVCLAADYRVMSTKAKVGLPETKLGIYPGWGGCVRFPRIVGADNAIEWIAGGGEHRADAALKIHAVDAVVELDQLRSAGIQLINECNSGVRDHRARRTQKTSPLTLRTPVEAMMVFETAKGFVFSKAGPNYPAPIAAIEAIQAGAGSPRDKALEFEAEGFVRMAKTEVASNLVTIFLSDQFVKKKSKKAVGDSKPVNFAAVLGAGIMGGGIAYQSAYKGTSIIMKDIRDEALELGMNEATKLLGKQVTRGRMDTAKMAKTIASITPTLSYGDFNHVDIVVEAVVENADIKKSVYKELEQNIGDDTIIASNTSTISISSLAEGVSKPENFCGMHFFNPVHRMPLVEVIRGEKTSDQTIARTVAYSLAMGKTPIVVNDCPGFLVNRILFPYFFGFNTLIADGVDFQRIDKVMEKFGWPMGPAYLNDVVGLDTAVHAAGVMAEGIPERMAQNAEQKNAIDLLVAAKRLGQKSGSGFYSYKPDRKGRPKKSYDESVESIIKAAIRDKKEVSDEEIVLRMMIPMINEAAYCLEENIVSTPMELDLALIYGLGFPPFRGGLMKYADSIGLKNFIEKSQPYAGLGKSFEPAPLIVKKADSGETFYQGSL